VKNKKKIPLILCVSQNHWFGRFMCNSIFGETQTMKRKILTHWRNSQARVGWSWNIYSISHQLFTLWFKTKNKGNVPIERILCHHLLYLYSICSTKRPNTIVRYQHAQKKTTLQHKWRVHFRQNLDFNQHVMPCITLLCTA